MMTATTTKWILFDIGGVLELVDDDNWPRLLAERWATRFGLTFDEYVARVRTADLPRTDTEQGANARYWTLLADALGGGATDAHEMERELWDAYCGEPNSDLIAFARNLIGQCRLAILSNSADGAREEEERRFGFSLIFDPICYSHEQGVNKPDAAAYERALARMHSTPERVFFIDDNQPNIDAAAALGIRGILHRDNATTIAAIEEFLRS